MILGRKIVTDNLTIVIAPKIKIESWNVVLSLCVQEATSEGDLSWLRYSVSNWCPSQMWMEVLSLAFGCRCVTCPRRLVQVEC